MEPIQSQTTAREILAAINEWARTANRTEVQHMWNILTALRGPDTGDSELKHSTTTTIRSAVLHNLAMNGNADTDHCPWTAYLTLREMIDRGTDSHFEAHIYHAAMSILCTEGRDIIHVKR